MKIVCWAFIRPNGQVLADSLFKDEEDAWTIGLGWPGEEEVEQMKKEGYRVEQVEITSLKETA